MKLIKKFNNLNKYSKLAIVVITIAFIVRLLLAIEYTPSGDGCWHSSIARYIGTNLDIPDFEHLGRGGFARTPIYHILTGLIYRAFLLSNIPNPDIALRLMNPIFGLLALIYVYKFAELVSNKKIAFFTVFFMSFIPLHLFSSYIAYLDVIVTFFVIATIYYLLKKRYVLAAIFGGLATLSNISSLAAIPVFIYIIWLQNKNAIKNFSLRIFKFISIIFIISFPWYLRNWIIFKNPIWPWLRFVLGGVTITNDVLPVNSFDPLRVFNIKSIVVSTYLGLFGVPDGNINAMSFFNFPFFNYLLFLWIAGTLTFLIPVFFFRRKNGLIKKDHIKIIIFWLSSYLLYTIATSSILTGVTYIRYALAAMPALALIWAIGLSRILEKIGNITKKRMKRFVTMSIFAFLIIIISGFVFTESLKTVLATKEWKKYNQDFMWIKENTPKDSLFMANGQCFSYHFNRETLSPPTDEVDSILFSEPVEYVWVNQKFKLHHERYGEEALERFNKDFNLVYQNNNTGTKVYQRWKGKD